MLTTGYEAFEAELTALDKDHEGRMSSACANTSTGVWPEVCTELTKLRTHTLEALRALLIEAK